jgi:hypothetical protein
MKLPITIEPLGKLVVLSWPTGKPPYTVSTATAATGAWTKLLQTSDTFTIVQFAGGSEFFTVEDSATGLARDNHFVLSFDGATAAVDIENPQGVMSHANQGYKYLYARNCPDILAINVTSNRLQVMELDGSTNLRQLKFGNNRMSAMPAGYDALPMLLSMECGNNPLTSLPLKGKTKLVSLICEECQISNFDTSECPALTIFKPYTNPFLTLDFSKNPRLLGIDTGDTMTFTGESFNENLCRLDAFGLRNGTWECYGSHPAGAGIQAEQNLKVKGWKISYA